MRRTTRAGPRRSPPPARLGGVHSPSSPNWGKAASGRAVPHGSGRCGGRNPAARYTIYTDTTCSSNVRDTTNHNSRCSGAGWCPSSRRPPYTSVRTLRATCHETASGEMGVGSFFRHVVPQVSNTTRGAVIQRDRHRGLRALVRQKPPTRPGTRRIPPIPGEGYSLPSWALGACALHRNSGWALPGSPRWA